MTAIRQKKHTHDPAVAALLEKLDNAAGKVRKGVLAADMDREFLYRPQTVQNGLDALIEALRGLSKYPAPMCGTVGFFDSDITRLHELSAQMLKALIIYESGLPRPLEACMPTVREVAQEVQQICDASLEWVQMLYAAYEEAYNE